MSTGDPKGISRTSRLLGSYYGEVLTRMNSERVVKEDGTVKSSRCKACES
jgi:hypothetical protein